MNSNGAGPPTMAGDSRMTLDPVFELARLVPPPSTSAIRSPFLIGRLVGWGGEGAGSKTSCRSSSPATAMYETAPTLCRTRKAKLPSGLPTVQLVTVPSTGEAGSEPSISFVLKKVRAPLKPLVVYDAFVSGSPMVIVLACAPLAPSSAAARARSIALRSTRAAYSGVTYAPERPPSTRKVEAVT